MRLSDFVNHWYDYRQNLITQSPFTVIIYRRVGEVVLSL